MRSASRVTRAAPGDGISVPRAAEQQQNERCAAPESCRQRPRGLGEGPMKTNPSSATRRAKAAFSLSIP